MTGRLAECETHALLTLWWCDVVKASCATFKPVALLGGFSPVSNFA